MKKTQWIDLAATIRKTLVSYISIAVFIAFGLAYYGGTVWEINHLKDAVNQTFDRGKTADFTISVPYGASEELLSRVKGISGVDEAEGYNSIYRFFSINGEKKQAIISSVTNKINILFEIDGTLPVQSNQIAVLRSAAEELDIKIGDQITFSHDHGTDYRAMYPVKQIAESDWEDLSSISLSDDDPGYLKNDTFTVTALVNSPMYIGTNPYCHGICAANGLYVDAVFFVHPDAFHFDAFGGYTYIGVYSARLHALDCFSDSYSREAAPLKKLLKEEIRKWDEKLLEQYRQSVITFKAKTDTAAALTGIQSNVAADSYSRMCDTGNKLAEQKAISGVSSFCDVNTSFILAQNAFDIVFNTKTVLEAVFLIIGILICYSVISRLMFNSTVQIGMKKALGFQSRNIVVFYLLYVISALIIGGLLGIIIGVFGIETAFDYTFNTVFTLSRTGLRCQPRDILLPFAVCMTVAAAVAAASGIAICKQNTTDLLSNKQSDTFRYSGISKYRMFQRLSLFNQIIVINLLKDKRRVVGMILGIAGSTLLLTAGFSYYSNYISSFYKQFDSYYRFNYQVSFEGGEETAAQIEAVLKKHKVDYAKLCITFANLRTPDNGNNVPMLYIPDDPRSLSGIMRFDTGTQQDTAYQEGVWMCDYYQHAFHAAKGSPLELETYDGKNVTLTVDEYYKYHLATPVIMLDRSVYERQFGETPQNNSFFTALDVQDAAAVEKDLEGIDGYIYMFNFYDTFLASFSSARMIISTITVIFCSMSVVLVMTIVINLLNVYVLEKKRELIILMINGYEAKQVKRYIYQDTAVLTAVGIIIGCSIGCVVGDLTLRATEGTSLRMIHGVSVSSVVLSALLTGGITFFITLSVLRKIKHLKLSDIQGTSC